MRSFPFSALSPRKGNGKKRVIYSSSSGQSNGRDNIIVKWRLNICSISLSTVRLIY